MPAPFVIWGIVIGATELYALLFATTATVAYVTYQTAPPIRWSPPSWERTWEIAEPVAIPWAPNGKEKIDPKVLDQTLALIGTLALTQILRGQWSVYDVHVINPIEPFINYAAERGVVGSRIRLPSGDIYRYGKTGKNSVYERYEKQYPNLTFSELRNRHVKECLDSGRLAPTQWYLYKYDISVANPLEKALIKSYTAIHGVRPAGNMNDQ